MPMLKDRLDELCATIGQTCAEQPDFVAATALCATLVVVLERVLSRPTITKAQGTNGACLDHLREVADHCGLHLNRLIREADEFTGPSTQGVH